MSGSLYDPNFSATRSAEKFRNNNAGAEFDLSHEKLDRTHEMSDGSTGNKTVVVTSQIGAITSVRNSECGSNKVDKGSGPGDGIRTNRPDKVDMGRGQKAVPRLSEQSFYVQC